MRSHILFTYKQPNFYAPARIFAIPYVLLNDDVILADT